MDFSYLPLDFTSLLAIAAGLGWASGIRLYGAVFVVGLAGRLGWILLMPWKLPASAQDHAQQDQNAKSDHGSGD